MDFALVFKKTQGNTVDWGITPSLIEKATSAVKVVKVVLVFLASPEVHIGNLKIAPEMACRVSICFVVVVGTVLRVCEPLESIVGVDILGMFCNELESLGPECFNGFGGVVDVDDKAVGLIVVLHVTEDIVVNVTEEAAGGG